MCSFILAALVKLIISLLFSVSPDAHAELLGCLPSLCQERDAIVLTSQQAVLLLHIVSHIPAQAEVQSLLVSLVFCIWRKEIPLERETEILTFLLLFCCIDL